MIEKIRGVGGPQSIKGVQGKKAEKSKGKKVEGESLNTEGRDFLNKIMEEARQIPDIREKLVEEMKRAVASGTYTVKLDEIVKRMLGGE